MKRALLLITSVLCGISLLLSCEGKDVAFEQTYNFNEQPLVNLQPLDFTFTNNEAPTRTYDVVLNITHTKKYQQNYVVFDMQYTSPNNEVVSAPMAFQLNENDKDSVFHTSETIFYCVAIQNGVNTFSFTPGMGTDTVQGIQSIQLEILRAN